MKNDTRQAWLRKGVTLKQILAMDLVLEPYEEPTNLRTYLCDLLSLVWEHGDRFDAKRPFGDSDWEHDVARALVREGLLDGEIDECDEAVYDHREFFLMMKSLIFAL